MLQTSTTKTARAVPCTDPRTAPTPEPPGTLFGTADVPPAPTRAHRVLARSEPSVVLPAIVTRTGTPRAVPLAQAATAVRAAIARSGALTVDVETTGYPVGHRCHRLRTVQLGDAHTAVVLDAGDPAHARTATALLAEAPVLHAHSAVADLVPLAHAGLIDPETAWERVCDTVILAQLASPATTGTDPGLKALAARILGGTAAVSPAADAARAALFTRGGWLSSPTPTTPAARSGWAQADPGWVVMARYAAADVLDTAALAAALPRPPAGLLAREHALARLTARITHTGLPLDSTHVQALLREHTTERARAAARVQALGIANPGSATQLAAALHAAGAELPPTATGGLSVAAPVLLPLRATPGRVGELAGAVLDYRHHNTVITTFLTPYQELATHGDGRLRPTIHTLGADTGRMSCVRPNLQNVPRQGAIRACITADPGHLLISADFSGVELRVAAALSGDTTLQRMICEGVDLHWMIARQVFGPHASKADRYTVKRGVFGRLYGGGIPTLARQIHCPQPTTAAMAATLDALTPRLTAWSARLRNQVKAGRTHYQTYTGAIVHLPGAYPHKAPNYAIQRTARELLADALLRWNDTPWSRCVILPVHDEILAMVPTPDAPHATAALLACMRTTLHGVPIHAEASTPSHAWADAA